MLLWSKRWFEAAGFQVLYGDTDSLFVHSGTDDPELAARADAAACRQRSASELARVHRGTLARAEPARAEVREAVSEAVPAAGAAQHARREQALRRSASRRRHSTRSSSSAWKSCVATGLRSPSRCSASCITACSPTSRSTSISRTSCGACAAASSTTRSSIARTCARTPTSTPRRRRRTSRRHASRRSPPAGSISYVMTTAGPGAARQRASIRSIASTTSRSRCNPVAEPVLETLGLDFEHVIGDVRQMDMYSLFGEP